MSLAVFARRGLDQAHPTGVEELIGQFLRKHRRVGFEPILVVLIVTIHVHDGIPQRHDVKRLPLRELPIRVWKGLFKMLLLLWR